MYNSRFKQIKTMKKIIIISILLIGFLTHFNAKSQTKEQTVSWLKAKSGSLLYATDYTLDIDQYGTVRMGYPQGSSNYNAIRVEFSKVSSVSYVKQLGKDGRPDAFMISLGGTFLKRYSPYQEEYTNASNVSMSYFSIDENEAKRIVKAYEHLATLCGAKVVSDDLFKN
jgi:hypothetical protein